MGRKGRLWCAVLIAACSCNQKDETNDQREIPVMISSYMIETKAMDPEENLISDLTLMIFDENGFLEEHASFSGNEIGQLMKSGYRTTFLKGKTYSIYACANTGFEVEARSIGELKELKCHLAYPDEYREGIPMAGQIEQICIEDETIGIELKMRRIMAKVSLRIDRGGLSDDVSMNVISARIGNCPKSAFIFRESRVESRQECFPTGFIRKEAECRNLNISTGKGLSGEISLYLLENMQGRFMESGSISEDKDKVFDKYDVRNDICSYVELEIDYISSSFSSERKPLIYRFYIGENLNSLDIERNCHYRITVIPEDDGLSDDSWRTDKTGLTERESEYYFRMSPSGYIQADVGDSIHVRCSYHPDNLEFDIGQEELDFDKSREIYDYEIDEDGRGVILNLRSPGTGILYMSAGEPVNETEILVIEVNKQ